MKSSTKLALLTFLFVVSAILSLAVIIDGIINNRGTGPMIMILTFGTWGYFVLRKRIKDSADSERK